MTGGVTWPQVALALIAAIPAIVAAFYGRGSKAALKTGNDKTVGEMVTEAHGVLAINGESYEQHGPVHSAATH